MTYSHEVEHMCVVKKGPNHGPAPIPEEGKWVKAKEIVDISGLTHGIGWCAPQQGACKLTLNVKEGVIQEALVETIGCSGMTHSAAKSCYDNVLQSHFYHYEASSWLRLKVLDLHYSSIRDL